MFSFRLLAVFLIIALVINVAMSGPKKGPGKKKGKRGQTGASAKQILMLDEEIKKLTERLDKLEKDEEEVDGSHVHFFFHSDGKGPAHVDSESVNVHVDIPHPHGDNMGHLHEAHCEMTNVNASGHVHIVQESGTHSAHFHVMFKHLGNEAGDYELHVHESGDLSKGCETTGAHYMTPDNKDGTIGHVNVESDGSAMAWLNDSMLSLEDHYSILGRSIQIHDPVSKDAIACCVIGWSGLMDTHGHHGHEPNIVEDDDDMDAHSHHGHNHGHHSH